MANRPVSVSDQLDLPDFHDMFQTDPAWSGDLGYNFRIHGQDYNGFRR